MAKFPSSPNYTGFNTPSRVEADITDLEIEGEVPKDIQGVFYRVAPDAQLPPLRGDDIWFNGDGMISMFRFENGRIDFKQRRARTDKFLLEEQAGRALFGAYRNPLTDDPSVAGRYRGTANTNVLMYGGQLLALKEDSPALAMDPLTLETKGYTDFQGQVKSPTFTAHPKIDPRTGDMCAFGYAAKGLLTRDMVYYELNEQGKLKREVWFEIPYYCMMHDFGLTEDYAVFHVIPIVSSWERLEAGLPHFGFDTTKDIYLGVLPRKGEASDIRWFKAPNCFASHVMNAFNDGTKVHIDVPMAKGNMFPFFPDVHGAAFDPQKSLSYMTRWTVDMDSRGDAFESMTRLTQISGEFPRIDERYASAPYRYGFLLSQDFSRPLQLPGGRSASGMMINTLARLDHATGETQSWWSGTSSTIQEPCFIPKPGQSGEGEGYLVAVVNRLADSRSDFLIFDAQRLADGPMATAKLEIRLRGALHGNWTPADKLSEIAKARS
jgi:carotenoid cleavage dioxygenase-like enzyme